MKFLVVFFLNLPVHLFMALSYLSVLLIVSIVPFEFHLLSYDFKLFELSMKEFSM